MHIRSLPNISFIPRFEGMRPWSLSGIKYQFMEGKGSNFTQIFDVICEGEMSAAIVMTSKNVIGRGDCLILADENTALNHCRRFK